MSPGKHIQGGANEEIERLCPPGMVCSGTSPEACVQFFGLVCVGVRLYINSLSLRMGLEELRQCVWVAPPSVLGV